MMKVSLQGNMLILGKLWQPFQPPHRGGEEDQRTSEDSPFDKISLISGPGVVVNAS